MPSTCSAARRSSIGAGSIYREGLLPCIDIAGARVQQGRYDEAIAILDSVVTVCREHGLRDLELLALENEAEVRLNQGRAAAAVAVCRAALAEGNMPSRMTASEIRLRLARALAGRDSFAAAADQLELALARGSGAVSLELNLTARLGEYRLAAGAPRAALAALQPAAEQAAEAGTARNLTALHTQLGRTYRRLAQPDLAHEHFNRAMSAWEHVRAQPDDPAWREHRGAVGDLFAEAAANDLDWMSGDAGLAVAFATAQRYKARTLQERMQGPGGSSQVKLRAPALDEVQRQVLHDGEVLLDVVEGEHVGVLFCVTRDTAFATQLPGRRVTAPRLRLLGDAVVSGALDSAAPVAKLAAAATAHWPPAIRRTIAEARLVSWCPDGGWHRFPMSLILQNAPPPALARVPSVAVLARLRTAAYAPDAPASVLAVSGPDPQTERTLPGAEAETRRLASRYRAVKRRDQTAAGVDTVAWRTADVLHLATHTRLDPWQPWNTTITLTCDLGGEVRAGDVTRISPAARLAVLAGCTTAGSRVVGGEGLIGLAGGFLAARTPAVVATLWPVDDIATARFMTAFYAALARDLPAAAALAAAAATCRADARTAAPRHWAGFVLVGDGDIAVPIRRGGRNGRWPLCFWCCPAPWYGAADADPAAFNPSSVIP